VCKVPTKLGLLQEIGHRTC